MVIEVRDDRISKVVEHADTALVNEVFGQAHSRVKSRNAPGADNK